MLYKNLQICTTLTHKYSIVEIYQEPFYGISALTDIKILESVIKLRKIHFLDVHNFKNINIPNKITKILLNTFYNVTIPESVKEITYEAF